MPAPSFDLVDILRTIQKRRTFIIVITVIAVVLGGVFFAVKKKKYKATCQFLVNNPLYGDRSTLFRSMETRYVDYFGGDDDLDKVTAIANSDTVKDRVIRNCDFDKIYPSGDLNDPKAHANYMMIFDKNFNIKRSEYKNMEISYIAYDPKTAAGVANMAEQVLEQTYRHYYNSMKDNISTSISDQVKQLDSAINVLTDTLAEMRDRYGIYSIVSPARQNVINGDLKGGGKGYGLAMEKIQNIESIKDQDVADRAHYVSVLNEFAATTNPSMQFLKVISRAVPPTSPTGLDIMKTMVIAGFLGLFFSVMYVLIIAYYRKLNAVLR
jgi:uncharacterized protein involved in exopolysaccharide biosynthesis